MSDLDRTLMEPIQLRQFSGVLPPRAANPTRLAELQALLAVHKAARPAIPWPMPPVTSDVYQAWDRANVAWVDQKARLVCEIEQEQGVIASAWRPCDPPPHALNPTSAPPPSGADEEPPPALRAAEGAAPAPVRRIKAPKTGAPLPAADPPAPRRVGRPPLVDTDDPKVLKRREQYRASAAKQQARRLAARSGVIR